MGAYFDGQTVPFQTAAQRKKLIGKTIKYLRDCDVDKSGRGYFFPRSGVVADAIGVQLILECGNSLLRSELVEIQLMEGIK